MPRAITAEVFRAAARIARDQGVIHRNWVDCGAPHPEGRGQRYSMYRPIGCAVGTLGIALKELRGIEGKDYDDLEPVAKELFQACLAAARNLAEEDGFGGTFIADSTEIRAWAKDIRADGINEENLLVGSNPLSQWFEGDHGKRAATRKEVIELYERIADRMEGVAAKATRQVNSTLPV